MTYDRIIAGALAAIVLIAPGVVAAQQFTLEEGEEKAPVPIYTSEVEVGVGYNSEDSFKFGEYRGLEDEGPFAIGNFSVNLRSPYDSDDSLFLRGIGTDLGLDSRTVEIEGGRQGKIKAFIEYNQIPRHQIENGRTPFIGAGTGNLTLPGTWVSGATTTDLTNLRTSSTDIDIETERKRFGGGLTWTLSRDWEFKANAQRELKEGTDTIGAAIASSGGTPRASILPEPIDYVTDDFDVSVGYSGARLQAELRYTASIFNNDIESLRFQNPYSGVGGWDPTADFPTGVGEMQLPPDNMAHHVSLSGGRTFGNSTRLTGSFVYGRMTQDEDFLPYTANPGLLVTTGLPRDSLEGEIETYRVNLGMSTRPLTDLDFDARYTYDLRDNSTPQDVFIRVVGDAADQATTLADSDARINLVYDYEQHKVDLEAGYRILPRTKASLAYEFDQRQREFEVVSKTREHTLSGKLRSTPFSFASGWIEYGHGFRDGSDYAGNRPFYDSHTDELLATLTVGDDDFENDPRLRKFWVADRDKDFVTAVLTFMPTSRISIGFSGNYTAEDYDESIVGLTSRELASGTVDVSYSPTDKLNLYGYLTYEDMQYDQSGCDWSPGDEAVCFDTPTDTSLDWEVDTHDKIWTVGAGLETKIIDDKLTFGADYAFSYGTTAIHAEAGPAVGGTNPPPPLPDLRFRVHSVSLHLDYKPRSDFTIRFGYLFEKFSSDDFALDGVDLDTQNNVIGLGEVSPDYTAHLVGVTVSYRF